MYYIPFENFFSLYKTDLIYKYARGGRIKLRGAPVLYKKGTELMNPE